MHKRLQKTKTSCLTISIDENLLLRFVVWLIPHRRREEITCTEIFRSLCAERLFPTETDLFCSLLIQVLAGPIPNMASVLYHAFRYDTDKTFVTVSATTGNLKDFKTKEEKWTFLFTHWACSTNILHHVITCFQGNSYAAEYTMSHI